jgi:hypothetical protein
VIVKEFIAILTAAVFFFGAIYPKPILIRATQEPHPNQLLARLCLAALGLLALWGGYMLTNSK